MPPKSTPYRTKIEPKSTQNRRKIDPLEPSGRSWASRGGAGRLPGTPDTRRDAIGTLPGRSVEPPGLSGSLPRRPQTLPRHVKECLQRVFAEVRARRRFHIDFRTVFPPQIDRFWRSFLRCFSIDSAVDFRHVIERLFDRRRRHASIDRFLQNLDPYRSCLCFERFLRSRTPTFEVVNVRRGDRKTIARTIENQQKNHRK